MKISKSYRFCASVTYLAGLILYWDGKLTLSAVFHFTSLFFMGAACYEKLEEKEKNDK